MALNDAVLGGWMQTFPQSLRPVAVWLTDLGRGIEVLVLSATLVILAVLAPLLRLRRRRTVVVAAIGRAAGFVFLSVAGGGLLALALKYVIGRARPYVEGEAGAMLFRPLAFDVDYAAFPSGHSATAGAMALSLALLFPRYRVLFVSLGVLICVSRQLVGVHWPSDTVMGWGVGAAVTLLVAHGLARRGMVFRYGEGGFLRPRSLPGLRRS